MHDYKIEIEKSVRKTMSLKVDFDGVIRVQAPLFVSNDKIREFINSHSRWINNRLKSLREIKDKGVSIDSDKISQLRKDAKGSIVPLVYRFAEIIGVKFNKITIKAQSTLWGSCSKRGNLNFNCLLVLAPQSVMEYVAVHELCHLKQMNHSRKFWELVAKYCPDYKEQRKWLKDNGSALLIRLQNK